MNDLLTLIQQGNLSLQAALEALIKQEIQNGETLDSAIGALIKQAEELNLEPALQALIKLQMTNHDELMKQLQAAPEVQKVQIMGAEVITIKGEKGDKWTFEELTDAQKEELRGLKGDDGEPLKWEDLTDAQKAEIKGQKGDDGDDGEVTEEHLSSVVSRVTQELSKKIPTAAEVAAVTVKKTPPAEIKTVIERYENKVTKKQILDAVKNDIKNFKILTGTDIINMINARKGGQRIDIDAIKGLTQWMQGGGRGEPHRFIELPDTPDAYIAGKWLKVNAEGTALVFVDEPSGGGGSGVTVETPTGSVNSVNDTFAVSDEPQWVVSDGITYFDGAGYTYSAPNITMTIPPSSFIRAII